MTLYELANYESLNEIEREKVENIKTAICNNTFNAPAILIWNDTIVTGSHRVTAAQELKVLAEKLALDDDETGLGEFLYDYEFETVDVTDILDAYFSENENEEMEYDFLRKYFAGTEVEEIVSKEKEW